MQLWHSNICSLHSEINTRLNTFGMFGEATTRLYTHTEFHIFSMQRKNTFYHTHTDVLNFWNSIYKSIPELQMYHKENVVYIIQQIQYHDFIFNTDSYLNRYLRLYFTTHRKAVFFYLFIFLQCISFALSPGNREASTIDWWCVTLFDGQMDKDSLIQLDPTWPCYTSHFVSLPMHSDGLTLEGDA